jgi:hypothetical protein
MPDVIDKLWKEVWKQWSKSNTIVRFPWADMKLVQEHPELENRIFRALTNKNRFLVSRCLVALESIHSKKLSALPPEIFRRKDRIQLIEGSFALPYTVGRLAREIVATYQKRKVHPDDLSDIEHHNRNL